MKKRKNKYDLLKKSLMDDITKTQRGTGNRLRRIPVRVGP